MSPNGTAKDKFPTPENLTGRRGFKPRLPGSCCIYLKRLFFNMLSNFLEQRRPAHAEEFRRFAMIAGKFV